MAPRSAKAVRFASISGRDGKYEEPSMNSGWSARVLASSPRRLFQSNRSYAREPRGAGACGLVQDSRRWKNGQRRNIPPGPGSAEIVACPIPCRASEYDACRPPGPEPITTTG